MPEIVELKIFAKSIKERFFDREVIRADYKKGGFDLNAAVAKKTLTDVRGHGKEMFFWFNGLPAFSVHLMLNGGFAVLNENTRPAAADVVAELCFEGGEYLMVFDPDGYAKMAPFDALPQVPEATRITETEFYSLLAQKSKAAVKNVLCDQNCVRGIGNAYADEILYAAKISPASKCGKLPDEVKKELYAAMRAVLENAIETYAEMYKGVTCGEMRDLVQVHTRARMTPLGELIKVTEIGGRKTYYTESQRVFI